MPAAACSRGACKSVRDVNRRVATHRRFRHSMNNSKLRPFAILAVCVSIGAISIAASPSKKPKASPAAAKKSAEIQNSQPLPPSALPLHLVPHERIALVGNSLAERMNLFGNFEALLHTRFPRHELVVRNFARPCDAVDTRQRSSNYTLLDDPLKVFQPDTFLCFYGFNE